MVNVGHDHVNDYCVNWKGVDLCYGGGCGFGAGAYGKTGWARRARVIELGQDPVTKEVTLPLAPTLTETLTPTLAGHNRHLEAFGLLHGRTCDEGSRTDLA